MTLKKIPKKYRVWIEARKRHYLSHKHIQMACELGLNPKKLGKLANHKQESWKSPLSEFIEELYWRRFRKEQPDRVESIEDRVKRERRKREEQKNRAHGQPLSSQNQSVASADLTSLSVSF